MSVDIWNIPGLLEGSTAAGTDNGRFSITSNGAWGVDCPSGTSIFAPGFDVPNAVIWLLGYGTFGVFLGRASEHSQGAMDSEIQAPSITNRSERMLHRRQLETSRRCFRGGLMVMSLIQMWCAIKHMISDGPLLMS